MNRVGVQSCAWYSDNDPDGSFRYIKECGFNATDFNIDHKLPVSSIVKGPLTTFFDQSIEEIIDFYRPLKAASEKYDVEISQMHAPFPCFVKDRDDVNAYLIMVLEKGVIIERGTHDDLIAKKGKYYQLYTGAFELE